MPEATAYLDGDQVYRAVNRASKPVTLLRIAADPKPWFTFPERTNPFFQLSSTGIV